MKSQLEWNYGAHTSTTAQQNPSVQSGPIQHQIKSSGPRIVSGIVLSHRYQPPKYASFFPEKLTNYKKKEKKKDFVISPCYEREKNILGPRLNPPSEFHGNPYSTLCVLLPTNQQTNKHTQLKNTFKVILQGGSF